ncbi:MAG: DUF5711 family protein [Oscillospiraceae bacterium]
MAKYKSIEEYRRKKRLKGFLKKILIVATIFGILLILLNVLEIFKGTQINELINKDETKQEEKFPLIIKNEQMVDIVAFNNNIAVLTKADVLIYNSSGKKMNSFIHGYTNPVLQESNKRILTYDRGGNKFRVDNSTGTVGEIQLKYNILTAKISRSGNIAVVTTHDRYACEIVVYNSNLKGEIYRYFSTEEISTISFSEDEQSLLGGAITSSEGIISTNLYELDITQEVDAKKTLIKDVLPLSIFYNDNNNIVIVGKDSVVTYNTNSNTEKRTIYKGTIQYFINSSSKQTILVNKNPFNKYSTVSVLSSDGVIIGNSDINDDVLDVYSDGSRIIVLCKTSVYNLDMTLKELNRVELPKSMSKAVYTGENLYILGADSIEKYKID